MKMAPPFSFFMPDRRAFIKTLGLRVSEEEEYVGLDISQHGERA